MDRQIKIIAIYWQKLILLVTYHIGIFQIFFLSIFYCIGDKRNTSHFCNNYAHFFWLFLLHFCKAFLS